MYKKVTNRISSPPTVQTEPEDLSSSPTPSVPKRGTGSVPGALAVPGGASSSAAAQAAAWAFSNNKLLVFCDIVLQHANYPHAFLGQPSCDEVNDESEESCEETKSTILLKNERVSESPLNSVGESARESTRSSTSSTDSVLAELEPEEVDKETFESVTCWCGKPFAGRPMIECEKCLVWYHMSCEQIRRNNIPQLFQCSKCKEKRRQKKRPSANDASNSSAGGREESRRNSKSSSSSGKKRKSSSFSSASSNSSSSGIPGSYSPQSDSNMSPFPHSTNSASSVTQEESNHHHHHDRESSSGVTPELESSLRIQEDPEVPPHVIVKIKQVPPMSPGRPRHRKSKSSGGRTSNGHANEKKKRKSGANRNKTGAVATVSSNGSMSTISSVNDVFNGLNSACGDSNHHVPPGCQPPRLLPCFETSPNTSHSSTSMTSCNNDHLHQQSNLGCCITSSSSSSANRFTGHRQQHHSQQSMICSNINNNNHHHHTPSSSSHRALPPPKLQPQVSMINSYSSSSSASPSSSSSSSPPPPPLLLSSNFVVDHQQQGQNPLILRHASHHHHHHCQTGVVVGGGGDTNPNHAYPFRE